VNLACKLGEDFAGKGEILLTRGARDALPPGAYRLARRDYRLGGEALEGLALQGRAADGIG
jgi:adenylate cyclase